MSIKKLLCLTGLLCAMGAAAQADVVFSVGEPAYTYPAYYPYPAYGPYYHGRDWHRHHYNWGYWHHDHDHDYDHDDDHGHGHDHDHWHR